MATDRHAHLLRTAQWPRPDVLLLGGFAVIAATIGVLGLLAFQGPIAALAASGAVTLAVGALAAPTAFRIAACASLVALPFITVWPELRPDEYSYPAFFAAALLGLVGLGAFQPRMFASGSGTVFLAYVSLAAAVVILPRAGLHGVNSFSFILVAFALYTLVRRATPRERRLFVTFILLLGAAESVLGLSQSLTGWPVFSLAVPELYESQRNYFAYILPGVNRLVTQGSGTFFHFNHLGALLSVCVPLALGVWLEHRRSVWRLAVLVLTVAGLISTFSRGALLGAIAGVLLVVWFGPTRTRRANVTLIIAVVVLVALFSLNVFAQYYETTQNATIRVQTWQTAVDNALDRPSNLALGYGYGYFQGTVLAAGLAGHSVTQQSGFMSSLHSSHLQLLLEFGLVGFVLFLVWLFAAFRKLASPASPLVVAALGGVLGLLSSQAFDNVLFALPAAVLAVLMAVAEGETSAASS